MGDCPHCGRPADRLHPLPPDVITRELLSDFDADETPAGLELCGDCVAGLG